MTARSRIQQEIILGIGGVRALHALGVSPTVWHLNEGHAAFVALQRIREQVEKGSTFDDALAAVQRSTVFTTHTPVPAGHDAFPFSMVEKHLAGCWGEMGVHRERFLALGQHDSGQGSLFNMTALAMRTAENINAVSALHGEVTRTMWQSIWPDTPGDQLPVRFITNGVHLPTWMAARLFNLLTRHLGEGWVERMDGPSFSDGLLAIPDAELWALREQLRHDLFEYVRERIRARWAHERVGANRVVAAGAMLHPHVLTLGYARRFASYKRPELIFHDPERLARILNNTDRPVRSSSRARRTQPTSRRSCTCNASSTDASTPRSGVVSPSWTITTCTWAITSCRGATCGSTIRASHSKRAAPAA